MFQIFELMVQRATVQRPISTNVFLYIFLFNPVSRKEEFYIRTPGTLYPNILGNFFLIFVKELKYLSSKSYGQKTHISPIFTHFFDITKCHEKKSFAEEHQVHCILKPCDDFFNLHSPSII